jgi:hypothetical protein
MAETFLIEKTGLIRRPGVEGLTGWPDGLTCATRNVIRLSRLNKKAEGGNPPTVAASPAFRA